jgi:hypothetical protein
MEKMLEPFVWNVVEDLALAIGLGIFLPCLFGYLLINIIDGLGDLFKA